MNLATRILGSSVGGGAIAVAMTLGMVALIRTEFEAQDRYEIDIGDINPISDDIQPPDRVEIKLDPYKEVEVPPAPEPLSTTEVDLPIGPIADQDDMIPDMNIPKPDLIFSIGRVIDQDVKCSICVKPEMPSRASKSGHCILSLSVSRDGNPYNIGIKSCSEDLFARNSIKAAARFKYQPKIQDGQPIDMHGVTTKITYKLADENGRLIPE